MKSSGFLLTLFMVFQLQAQAFEFESSEGNQVYNHRILMDDSYIIETIYQSNPTICIDQRWVLPKARKNGICFLGI